jgi:hypothetical protein
MDFTDTVEVLWVGGRFLCVGGGFEVECILEVSGGVLLGNEEGVKVPETGFDEGVRWHLFETGFVVRAWKERMGGRTPFQRRCFGIPLSFSLMDGGRRREALLPLH